jgi:hypothetical protein
MSVGFHGTQASHFIYAHTEAWPSYASLQGTYDMQVLYITSIYLLSKHNFYCDNFYKTHNHSIHFCGHLLYQILAQSAQKCSKNRWNFVMSLSEVMLSVHQFSQTHNC